MILTVLFIPSLDTSLENEINTFTNIGVKNFPKDQINPLMNKKETKY